MSKPYNQEKLANVIYWVVVISFVVLLTGLMNFNILSRNQKEVSVKNIEIEVFLSSGEVKIYYADSFDT